MHESVPPPAPLRFCGTVRYRLVMTRDDGVGDVSAVQTTPSFEIHLTADVQNIHKMIRDQAALTALASHTRFLRDEGLTISCESVPARLRIHQCRRQLEAKDVFLRAHHTAHRALQRITNSVVSRSLTPRDSCPV